MEYNLLKLLISCTHVIYIILYINYTSLKERESCQLVMAEHYEEYLRESWMKKVRLEKLKVSGSGPISAQIWLVHFAAFLLVTQPLNEFHWRQKTYFFFRMVDSSLGIFRKLFILLG